jgi:hypothetical protein
MSLRRHTLVRARGAIACELHDDAMRPEILPMIYTDCLTEGIHPWRQVTVVAINKPFKPDYSKPKAYRPISLMECAGKLLEKIVAKRVNDDIQAHNLLPMTQFGSCPHHSAVDAAAILVHRIQATQAAKRASALLLFDISGFFDNVNPAHTVQIFRDKGFPDGTCSWIQSFSLPAQPLLEAVAIPRTLSR